MTTTTYRVTGMTCEHCVRSVTEEVSEIPGVAEVSVDLDSGGLTVTGDDVAEEAVAAAVTEAGYDLSPARPRTP